MACRYNNYHVGGYGPEVGDGGEGEHILGLRMHKAHFLSREPRHVSSTGEVDVLVACGEARLVMDWKYLHLRTDVTRTRGLWYLIAKAAEKPGRVPSDALVS